MLSRFDPYFQSTFRQAESTDTRQAIRHEEHKDGRKRRDDERPSVFDNSLWEDSASVSVDALKAFLINFLKSAPFEENVKTEPLSAIGSAAPRPGEPRDTVTARAIGAYQTMSYRMYPDEQPIRPPVAVPDIPAGVGALNANEVRTIHRLIADLDDLHGRGLRALPFQMADSFLESLVVAVAAAKARL